MTEQEVAEKEVKVIPAVDSSLEPVQANWRSRVLAIGGLVGAILGVLSAYLYLRSVQETHGDEPPPDLPKTGDAVKLGMALMSIIRTVAEWGKR
jgi:molybdopterin/thiamine biosynthesis adenylyltransferase